MKKLLTAIEFLGIILILVGCNGGDEGVNEIRDILYQAADTLESEDTYIISSVLSDSSGQFYSIDVKANESVYTQYPVDESGNVGTLPYGTSSEMQYSINEWLDKNGVAYVFSGDAIYRLPSTYNDWIDGKSNMYVVDMLERAYDFKAESPMYYNDSNEEVLCYSFKVPSDLIKNILGASSYGMYESIYEVHKEDNIGILCGYYIVDYDFVMTCSDANVFVGVDSSGRLCYCMIEVGGLGQRMYLTKLVYDIGTEQDDYCIDFSSAVDFEVTLSDFADFVAQYNSYDEAIEALESMEEMEVSE